MSKCRKEKKVKKTLLLTLAVVLLLAPAVFSQSKETGAIRGVITDQQDTPLPGVSVTLTSPNLMGVRTFITDANGEFRFPALPVGDYQVKAELQGFGTVVRENIRVNTTITLTVDIEMEVAAISEEITVIGQSPTVDVKSTETASVTLSNEILRNIPYSQFTAEIVNMAPGVVDEVAFGASSNTGIAYSMDGVNVADPEAGSAWVFLDHNIIEEAKVMGLGLPAEYGNFTGVIFNLVTKSGGNEFSGHFEFDYQGKQDDGPKGFWQTSNNSDYADDFPEVTAPLEKLIDISGHLGGPIIRDKLWFYLGLQWYRTWDYPTGFPEAQDYKQPHGFLKLTSQLSPKTNLMGSVQVDSYNGINRYGAYWTSPEATVNQESPEVVGNFSLTHILSPKTFFDVKGAFFWGYYYLEPEMGRDVSGHYLLHEDLLVDNWMCFGMFDRWRYQANASVTHYAEDFITGDHDFKFGVEVEHSRVRNRYGYNGDNNFYYIDYVGYGPYGYYYNGNYLAYQWEGYDTNTRYTRLEGFVQDSWQITKRLNINAGVRVSQFYGTVKDVAGTVYNNFALAPRFGFTFDLLGDKTTIIKAHYGHFTEALLTKMFDRMNPVSVFSDYVGYYWDVPGEEWVEMFRDVPIPYEMDQDMKHPYMIQFTAGIERELFRDASISFSFISRRWKNIVGVYDRATDYELIDYYDADLDRTFQVYERTSGDAHDYVLANITDTDPWILENPYRKYTGFEVLFNKRFSNRWQLIASYVYGKAKGTVDNAFARDLGGWDDSTADPNSWINAEGTLTNDPTHMFKLQGTYVLPFDINFNFYFRAITGNAWTTRYRTGRLNQGRVTFLTEERGSNHYKMQKTLDLRLEKIFTLANNYRLGILVDVFNVFNDSTIRRWGTILGYDYYTDGTWPSTGGHQLDRMALPRRARVGVRIMF